MTTAEEWTTQFERETGKTIRDGRLCFKDPEGAVVRAITEYRRAFCNPPKRIRVSVGVRKDLLLAALGARRYMEAEDVERFMGVPVETDYAMPEAMLVVE